MRRTMKLIVGGIAVIVIYMTIIQRQPPAAPKKTSVAEAGVAAAIEPKKTGVAPVADVAASDIPLTLIINNLESSSAPVIVGLYGANNKFPDPKDQLKEYKFKPHGKELVAKITNLDFGVYALAIYQDINDNGKIDKNLLGIPTEPYAFSNNYKPAVKAPCFDNCKFDYDTKSNTVTMTMIRYTGKHDHPLS